MRSFNELGQFIFITIILSFALDTDAQRIIVNSNGDRIIMYPDGSWRAVEAGDSLLLRQNVQKSETIGIENEGTDPFEIKTIGEQEEYILRQWNELHFNIKEQEKKVQNEFRTATNAQFRASELLNNAEANKTMIEPDQLAKLMEDYEESVRNLRTAKTKQKLIRKIGDQSQKLASLPPAKIESKLNPLRSKFNSFLSSYGPGHSVPVPEKQETKLTIVKNNEQISGKDKGKAGRESEELKASGKILPDGMPPQNLPRAYKSEPFKCHVISDTTDEATGRRRIELAPGLIFTHTDPDLRPYFKDKELITCYGKLSKIDAYVYFSIDFQIASSHSQSNFGSLQNGSLLRLSLLNGQYVSLYNLKSDRGRIDPYSGNTIFTGQYALGKNEIALLLSSELDKFRILWSTGYEDYDIYKVDFFIDQLKCLLKN